MKLNRRPKNRPSGVSLVETMVAVGVLALVIPLALSAMVKAGDVSSSGRAETRAPAIAEQCLLELEAARSGKSQYFPALVAGQKFPEAGQVMVLGFGPQGELLGKISKAEYDGGLKELAGEQVSFLASMSGDEREEGDSELLSITVRIEYPALLRQSRRSEVSFYTKLP